MNTAVDLHNKREVGRKAVCKISEINAWTTYRVEPNTLILRCTYGSLTKEQADIAREYKSEIVEYLTISPPHSTCARHITMDMYGKFHKEIAPIEWTCTEYGVWVCMCYYKRQLESFKMQEAMKQRNEIIRSKTVTYWQDLEKSAV